MHNAEGLSDKYQNAISALANEAVREKYFQLLKKWTHNIPALIRHNAQVDSATTYYEDVIIGAGTALSANSVVGVGGVIESDVIVEDGTFVDRFSNIGANSVIKAGVIMSTHSVVESGSRVKKSENPTANAF